MGKVRAGRRGDRTTSPLAGSGLAAHRGIDTSRSASGSHGARQDSKRPTAARVHMEDAYPSCGPLRSTVSSRPPRPLRPIHRR